MKYHLFEPQRSAQIGGLVNQAVTPFRGSALVILGRTNV